MKHKKKILLASALLAGILLCRCCAPKYNQPLLSVDKEPVATIESVVQDTQMLFATTFSGGGTRAMAMGYFVCKELNKVIYKDSSTLMKEIDITSGVSGGSFVSAALPIYRNDWDSFYTKGVIRDIQGDLVKRMLLPWNWPKLLSPYYTRTDLASEYYHKHIFKKHTFGSILPYPILYINSTLLAQGTHFVYNDDYFRYINSNIKSYPIGYACAASSAFPVGFPAMTLKNYGKTATQDSLLKDRKYKRAFRNKERDMDLFVYWRLRKFLNDKSNEWIHNQDGGIAGNTGIKRILDECKTNGIINRAINNVKNPLKRIVLLTMDAGTQKVDQNGSKQSPPNSLDVVLYTTTTSMDILSGERFEEVKDYLGQIWQVAQQSQSGMAFEDRALSKLEKPYLIEINARNIKDPKLATDFNKLPTSFHLDSDQLMVIESAVNHLLNNNSEYQRLLESILNDNN